MVKTEFAKFGDVVEATKKSIDAAAKKFDEVGVRTRAIQKRLRDVQDLPAPDMPEITGVPGVPDIPSTPGIPGLTATAAPLLGAEDDLP
jgi:DNA recombination protein RmuC